jgi:hypothetical protein
MSVSRAMQRRALSTKSGDDLDHVDPDKMRQRFREIFDEIYAPKPKKPRDLNLRARPPKEDTAT